MSSGNSLGIYALIQRVQSVSLDFQIPRTETHVLGRFKPLPDRPVINYTPVTMSCNYVYGNKDVPRNLGILNSTGVATLIGQGTQITDWGCRTYPVYLSPVMLQNYVGEIHLVSGVLKSFALAGSVNEPVRGTFSVEGLDLQQITNNGQSTTPNYSGQLVRFQDAQLTGIDFTGLGYSGLIIQSFQFATSFTYASDFNIGSQYPVRRMIGANSSLQLSAYIAGTTNTVTGLGVYSCGTFITGTYVLTLQPSCNPNEPPTVITMQNPYLESQSFGASVGNFIEVSLGFSCPLTIVPFEATGFAMGSNLTIT